MPSVWRCPPSSQADRRALNITLNSIGTELTRDDRRKLYANFGLLYPHGQVGGWLCFCTGVQACKLCAYFDQLASSAVFDWFCGL